MFKARAATRLLLATTVSMSLAACGHTAAPGADRTVQVALSEYRVTPQKIRSTAGELTLIVQNDGRLTHNLAISIRGNIVGQTPPLQPGADTALTLVLTPGTYLMTSTLFADQALGTYGTLTVVS
jgi:uncharacterized cupredoxin-like copper-binding protein